MANADAVIATRAYKLMYKVFNSANALPADTVAYGDAVTGYTDVGYTSGGLNAAMDQTRAEVRVDQSPFPIRNPITEVSFTLSCELAEMTPANLLLASGLGSVTSLAPSTGVRGHDDWALTDSFTDTYRTWFARVQQPDNEVFQMAIWKGLATGNMDTTFEPDNPATIAIEIQALTDSSTSPARIATVRDVLPAT